MDAGCFRFSQALSNYPAQAFDIKGWNDSTPDIEHIEQSSIRHITQRGIALLLNQ